MGEAYIKYRMRVGRGNSYTGEINGLVDSLSKAGVIVIIISQYFNYKVPLWVLPLGWLVQKIVEFMLGYADEKYLHWWHFENEYLARNLNPWNQEVMAKLDQITKQTNPDCPCGCMKTGYHCD